MVGLGGKVVGRLRGVGREVVGTVERSWEGRLWDS